MQEREALLQHIERRPEAALEGLQLEIQKRESLLRHAPDSTRLTDNTQCTAQVKLDQMNLRQLELITVQEREALLQHIERRPEAPWKASSWSFKNENRCFGSPWFDQAYRRALGQPHDRDGQFAAMLASLRSSWTPWRQK